MDLRSKIEEMRRRGLKDSTIKTYLAQEGIGSDVIKSEKLKKEINFRPRSTPTARCYKIDLILKETENYDFISIATRIGLYTALRANDILNLRWDNFNGNILCVYTAKTNKTLTMEINDELYQYLSKHPDFNTEKEIFKGYSYNLFWRQFKKIAKRLGLKDVSPHSLRVTAISTSIEAGATLDSVMIMSGHSKLSTVEKYFRQVQNPSRAASKTLSYK